MYGLRVGADMYESNKLTGAIDELYVYTSALDREAISVLYGSVTAPRRGDTYKNGHARNLGPTESRDGGDALGFDGEVYAVLPDALTYEALTGDEERTICLWARIDDWDGGFLFEYGSDSADGASFGLAVGDAESNVTLALSGSYQTVVTIYGNTSYIDWDDWHHYCLTYDGSDVVLYFDGLAEATAPASLDTETMYGLRVGADMYESNKLTGAIDELYVYTSALDREAISVLYGGDTYKNGHARNLGPTESRDGGDALGFDGEVYAVLPDALTYEALTGDEERTICLWARIDDWDGGFLFEYGSDSADGASFGLAVGDAESNVTLALSGSYQTVVTIYGNTSYIDWDDWHHYCLTYDGSDVVLYFDGLAEATAPASLDTETMYGLRVGADMYESNKLTGAIDELYVYTSALDREAISVSRVGDGAPTVTPAPSTYYFEGTLRAYYSFDEGNATDATGAYSGDTYKNGMARNLGPTESRDGGTRGFDGEVYAVLPDALTYEALTGDEERTICLWARIDDWDGGFLRVRSDSADGASLGLAVGDAESNVTLALSGSYQTVVTIYGNTSYIDWDDWHHYCLTYDGSDVVLYFDGLAEATAPASLDTETMYGLRVGADMYESNKLTGAIDELYVYTSALDREAISVLYGSVTASPTVTPAPSTYYFEGTLRAYYSFDEGNATDATGAYSGDTYKNGHARNLGPTESRDGGDALGFDGETVVTIYGNTSYIDWDDWHHYCLTYDGSDAVLYSTASPRRPPGALDTETMYGLRVGADMYESNKLTGAIDELYVYTSALDREAISVLYGSVTAPRR
ncbi:hypothetical protein JL720_5629 [Aureococcus anophagefferens]|nr:hypothetical protein JL720_5629 [Aureococcus anophagefferens]